MLNMKMTTETGVHQEDLPNLIMWINLKNSRTQKSLKLKNAHSKKANKPPVNWMATHISFKERLLKRVATIATDSALPMDVDEVDINVCLNTIQDSSDLKAALKWNPELQVSNVFR